MASWKHITNFFASLYYKTDDMLRAFQQKLRSMFLDAAAISQSPSKSACGLGLAGRPAGDRRQPAVPGGGWAEDHGQRGRAHYYAAMCCRLVAGRPAGRRGRSSSSAAAGLHARSGSTPSIRQFPAAFLPGRKVSDPQSSIGTDDDTSCEDPRAQTANYTVSLLEALVPDRH
jgi:hypothetical protein